MKSKPVHKLIIIFQQYYFSVCDFNWKQNQELSNYKSFADKNESYLLEFAANFERNLIHGSQRKGLVFNIVHDFPTE